MVRRWLWIWWEDLQDTCLLCYGHICMSFWLPLAPLKSPPHLFFPASLLCWEIISWSPWHALESYQPPGMSFTTLRYTIPYFSSLVDHVISYYNRPIFLNLPKVLVSGSVHGIHNRPQSLGPVLPVTQGYYDDDNRTLYLILAIAMPLSGNKNNYFDHYCRLTHFLPVVSLLCLVR